MKHPEKIVARYARGEKIRNWQRLFEHLRQCERCRDMVFVIQEFIKALREEGKLATERPSIETVLQNAGLDNQKIAEIAQGHFQKKRDLQEALQKLPARLETYQVQSAYEWYLEHLCADRIFDPRGNRVRFFPKTFIRLTQIKNIWGHEPKHSGTALEKIHTGKFHFPAGLMVNSVQRAQNRMFGSQRMGELSWAKLIASEPTGIFLDRRSMETDTETYVKNFGTNAQPLYRVMICKVNGANRDVLTIFPRNQLDTRDVQKQLWPITVP